MFVRTKLRTPQEIREFGQLNLVSSVLSFASSLYSSYTAKSIATKNRRLERTIAGQQLALQERALKAEEGYQTKAQEMENTRLLAWLESEKYKAEAMANAPLLSTSGAMRIDQSALDLASASGVRGRGSYSMLTEEPITPTETSFLAKFGIPSKVMGIPTEYIGIGGGLILLLSLTE